MKRLVAAAALVALAAAPRVVHAQAAVEVAKAEGLFHEGVKLLEQKKYADACVMLEESRKIAVGLGVTLYLADCYENLGKTGTALELFRAAEKLAAERKDAREKVAQERAEKLQKTAPRLILRVSSGVAAADQQVIVDGRRIEPSAYGTPLVLDPGAHKIQSVSADGRAWESELVAIAGGSTTVDIPLLRPSPAPPAATPPVPAPPQPPKDTGSGRVEDPGRTQRTIGFVVGGLGVVGLGLGTVFGLGAKSKQSDSNADGHCDANNKCDPTGLALRQDALSAATASTIFFVAGGVALAGGAVLYLTAPKARTTGLVVAPVVGGRDGASGLVARGVFP